MRWVKILELLQAETTNVRAKRVRKDASRIPLGKLHMRLANPTTMRRYWVQVFTVARWNQFINAGAKVSSFRENRWGFVRSLKPRDYLLCYVSRVSRWVGILEVKSEPYLDNTRIWEGEIYPCRAEVQVVTSLPPENGVPMRELADKLSIFRVANWRLFLMASPTLWKESDARAVIDAIQARR